MIILSEDPNVFDNVRATLRSDGRFTETDGELRCDGSLAPLTNIYTVEIPPAEWDGWHSGDSQIPDPNSMAALIFETRSSAWIAEVGILLARRADKPLWFVDSEDTVWPADQVDPDRIALA